MLLIILMIVIKMLLILLMIVIKMLINIRSDPPS
jgi:hypothetical protein